MAEVVIVVPVLRRPHRVVPLMDDVDKATPCNYRLLFVASPNDAEEIKELERCGADFIVTPKPYLRGDYPAKINQGYRESSAPWIVTGADDLHFHKDWFEEAMWVAVRTGAMWIGTNDLTGRLIHGEPHPTHSIVHRSYADDHGTISEKGLIYHPGYWHEFCDDEAAATARFRGMYAWSEKCVIEHMHPYFGKAPSDEVYETNKANRVIHGRSVYRRRKKLWGQK